MLKPESLTAAPISPAGISAASICFAPNMVTILPSLSDSPVEAFTISAPAVNLPLSTLKKESLPMNGSATVLKQIAAREPFASAVSSIGSSSQIAYSDDGAGQTSAIKSSS